MPSHVDLAAPRIDSLEEHLARRDDVFFWRPYVCEILDRHGLLRPDTEVVAGFNPTHPTFLCGDVVLKLFGWSNAWRDSHAAEHAAQALVGSNAEIRAPVMIAAGNLSADEELSWPYLLTTRMSGVAWHLAAPTLEQQHSLASELGEQVRRIHALEAAGIVAHEDWRAPDIATAARKSSLPPHLAEQAQAYSEGLGPFDRVFIHADLVAAHVFVESGRLAGIIDWGDAMRSDRHCELIQVYRDLFACDKALFATFLEACEWPVDDDFPRRALGFALHRQAVGLAQHYSIDVFQPIAEQLALEHIPTLDDLAHELFALPATSSR